MGARKEEEEKYKFTHGTNNGGFLAVYITVCVYYEGYARGGDPPRRVLENKNGSTEQVGQHDTVSCKDMEKKII